MFTLKNALKNIYRYKSKYILFGLLYLILLLSAAVCANIYVQTGKAADHIIKEYAGVVRFAPVTPASQPLSLELSRFAKDEFLAFKGTEHIDDVKIFKYNFATSYIEGVTFENWESSSAFLDVELRLGGSAETVETMESFFFKPVLVIGYDMSLLHLESDVLALESGRMFENDSEAVIAKNRVRREYDVRVAALQEQELVPGWNDLELGDTIAIKNEDGFHREYTVVGILEASPDDDINTNRQMIHTTFEGAECFEAIAAKTTTSYDIIMAGDTNARRIEGRDTITMGYDALIYLDDPDNYYEVWGIMLEMGVLIEPFHQNFNILVNMMRNMQSLSVVFMVLAALIVVCVAIISTAILLNSRKYEIAVLRSIGMKKGRLILGYLAETLAFVWGITLVSLMAAQFVAPAFVGGAFANMQALMSAESFESLAKGASTGIFGQNSFLVFGGATAVAGLSLILACVNIVRFEPLKIFGRQY